MKSAEACDFESEGRRGWLYDEYYFKLRDDEARRIGEGENHWTGAESMEWYKGQFVRDTMNGYGEYRWRYRGPENVSATYEGYFLANKLHGYGTMSYSDGRTFRGLYYKDVRWGPGVQYLDLQQDVGFWRGNQLVRLAWRPETSLIAPNLSSADNGEAFVDQFRTLLARDTNVFGETNSAVDLLKECGMDPMEASKHWTKLYAKNCNDLRNPACDVNAFQNHYYKGTVHSLRHLTSKENCHELAYKKRLYYAWNNNKAMVHMMQHSFKHDYQRSQDSLNLEAIVNGQRNKFYPPGPIETDARTMLMCCYLGRLAEVVKFVNENGVNPNLTDNLGNSALVYATCGEEIDLIHFLVEAGANVNGVNDSCCTPLSVALLRFACARRGVPFDKITKVVVPNSKQNHSVVTVNMSSTKSGKPIAEDTPKALDWIIKRIPTISQRTSISRRSILLRKSITRSPVSVVEITTPTKISTGAIKPNNSLASLSEPNLSTSKSNINTREKDRHESLNNGTYDLETEEKTKQSDICDPDAIDKARHEYLINDIYQSDDLISGNNKLYENVSKEYMIKINKVFPAKASSPTYLFNVDNMIDSLLIDKEEDQEFSTPLNTQKDVSVIWQGGSKTAIDSLSVLVPDRCPQMMLTIMQLLSDGADPKLVRCPEPALLIAVAAGCPDLIRYLASHGADVNETFPSARNYNALEIVMSRSLALENFVLMRALLDSGADVNHRIHYHNGFSPTLMHILMAKKTQKAEEEEILEASLKLFIKHNCNPFMQFMGYSAVDMIMKRWVHLLDLIIKMPGINLNEMINDDNQTILVKMFSVPFFEFYHCRMDLCPMITELLLRGADPLISCQFQGKFYENIFELLHENINILTSFLNWNKRTESDLRCAHFLVELFCSQLLNQENKFAAKGRKTSNHIGQGDASMKKDKTKKKDSLKLMPTLQDHYRNAVDLLTSCVRMMHVKWLQGKLVQELVRVVYKYKHRWWNMIIKEHKNQAATAIWVSPVRFIEIWDILKTTKKKVYNDEVVLKSTLCILHLYQRRKNDFPMNLTISAAVKDEIQSDVRKIIKEYKNLKLNLSDVQMALQSNDVYVKAELETRKTNKYNICFECCIPLQKEQGIPCTVCQSVLFCTTECVKNNIRRFNCHLCNELEGAALSADNGSNGSMAVSGF